MSRQSFEYLARMMAIYLNSNDSGVPVQTKLLLTLWTLANVESFRGIGDRFGMYMGNVHYIFLCTTRAFRLNSIKFIKWPTRAEYRSITLQFSFPYAIGSVDSTFIRIRKPLKKYNVYTNRKKFCAVTLQAVSKPNLEFIDVSTGYPSSMHDASVFAHSQLGRNLSILLEGTPFVLLGDSAYGLTTTLMKPYPDNGRLDEVWIKHCSSLVCRTALQHETFQLVLMFMVMCPSTHSLPLPVDPLAAFARHITHSLCPSTPSLPVDALSVRQNAHCSCPSTLSLPLPVHPLRVCAR
ncbi:Uncharacterized protein APZ42_033446 [Daphnia magna]|uniref:DDE Tnp4 domain-containing protein n=1 Tax=Daphnia magna TaxID=35525 RepID=A0A164L390_9CRUS|nr:Uncharacterized protein APZ42_033446 [Daphnia magna]